jgi:DNA-directed RNA polymerase specialized sigma24 family protein
VLRYLEELSAREVGAVLGISEAAAMKRALRALQRLRDALTRDHPEEGP